VTQDILALMGRYVLPTPGRFVSASWMSRIARDVTMTRAWGGFSTAFSHGSNPFLIVSKCSVKRGTITSASGVRLSVGFGSAAWKNRTGISTDPRDRSSEKRHQWFMNCLGLQSFVRISMSRGFGADGLSVHLLLDHICLVEVTSVSTNGLVRKVAINRPPLIGAHTTESSLPRYKQESSRQRFASVRSGDW
jgi:hypothetical protein